MTKTEWLEALAGQHNAMGRQIRETTARIVVFREAVALLDDPSDEAGDAE